MLIDLPSEKTQQLCTILEKEWPLTTQAINYIKRCHGWNDKEETSSSISLLYSKDNEESGVFVAVHKTVFLSIITVYALDGYEEVLKEELMNWNFVCTAKIAFDHVLPKHNSLIEEIMKTKNYVRNFTVSLLYYSMPIESALKLNVECPDDVAFGQLSAHHIDEIYKSWVLKDSYSIDDLRNWYEFDKKYATGVFCKKTGALLSRCLRSHLGWITALQTAESAQGKGYAKLLMKKVCKTLAEDSIEPRVYTVDFNKTSQSVLRGVGLKHIYDCISLQYTRKK